MAETSRTTEHIPEWKRAEVDALADLIDRYDSVGVVDITGIPARQLQEMRRDLHGDAEIRMSRNTLIVRALERADADLGGLVEFVTGHVGLIGTDDNPFGLFKQLEESKTPAPISAGEVAPNDIVIEAGDTGMDPGPFVGDLQNVGANARIQEGSIHVLEDSTVAEAGDEVSPDLANVLSELGVEPKEVGLDLRAVYADGVLFEPADLDIDVDAYRDDIATAATRAQSLAVGAGVPTDRTAPALLSRARGQAVALGLQAGVETPDLADELVARADEQVRALAAQIEDDEALPEALRDVEAPSEEAQVEETDTEAETEADDADDAAEEAADDGDDDEDDDGDAADGLGEMFG